MSLIETILYLGIAVLVLGALFSYGWNVILIGTKSQVVQEVVFAGQLIGERLRFEIREAESVSSVSPSALTLQQNGEAVTIEVSSGTLTIKRGSAAAVPLHSQDIRINNFSFTNQLSSANETDYVGFAYDAAADYFSSGGRNEYQYSLPFVSGSSLRVLQ